jgi:caffeoyl-CoA O-methyltransferase
MASTLELHVRMQGPYADVEPVCTAATVPDTNYRNTKSQAKHLMKTRTTLPVLLIFGALVLSAQAQPGPERRQRQSATLDFASTPLPKDDAEKRILDVLEEIVENQGRGIGVPREDGRLLRLLTESIGAKHVVELGTYHGYSGIWFCLALRTTSGRLTTFEINTQNAEIARQNFKRAGVSPLVNLVEGDAHQEVTKLKDPIDLVFIDADKEGYADYLKKLLPLVRPGGLVVAHNIDARMADPAYIKAITTDPSLETLFLNVRGSGIAVSMKKR